MKFGSNGKGGPQASHLGQIVRGTTGIKFRSNSNWGTTDIKFGSNSKGGPQASNLGQIVRGDHRHQISVKW